MNKFLKYRYKENFEKKKKAIPLKLYFWKDDKVTQNNSLLLLHLLDCIFFRRFLASLLHRNQETTVL